MPKPTEEPETLGQAIDGLDYALLCLRQGLRARVPNSEAQIQEQLTRLTRQFAELQCLAAGEDPPLDAIECLDEFFDIELGRWFGQHKELAREPSADVGQQWTCKCQRTDGT